MTLVLTGKKDLGLWRVLQRRKIEDIHGFQVYVPRHSNTSWEDVLGMLWGSKRLLRVLFPWIWYMNVHIYIFAIHKLRNFSSPSTVKPHLSPPPGASTASWPRPLDLVEWSVPYGSEVQGVWWNARGVLGGTMERWRQWGLWIFCLGWWLAVDSSWFKDDM